MRFDQLDELARKDETAGERTRQDQRHAELRASPYAGIAIRDAREEAIAATLLRFRVSSRRRCPNIDDLS